MKEAFSPHSSDYQIQCPLGALNFAFRATNEDSPTLHLDQSLPNDMRSDLIRYNNSVSDPQFHNYSLLYLQLRYDSADEQEDYEDKYQDIWDKQADIYLNFPREGEEPVKVLVTGMRQDNIKSAGVYRTNFYFYINNMVATHIFPC